MRNFHSFNNLFFLVIFANSLVYAGTKSEFTIDDTSYSYSVTIPACMSCNELSILLFDDKTVRQLSRFVDSIHFSKIDSLSQFTEMHFRKWFYKGFSRYKRVLFPADSLTIDLLKFEHNMPSIPQLKKAVIRYHFAPDNDSCAVRYYQRVVVNRKISFVYRKMIELHLNNFTRALENSVRK